eukprot:763985-Hanusia_phi.AAC.4
MPSHPLDLAHPPNRPLLLACSRAHVLPCCRYLPAAHPPPLLSLLAIPAFIFPRSPRACAIPTSGNLRGPLEPDGTLSGSSNRTEIESRQCSSA